MKRTWLPGILLLLPIDGVVGPVAVETFDRVLERARSDKAVAVIVRIDTPGGLLDPTRRLTAKMTSSPVPVITWVGPSGARAASAGFFLLQAGDVAAMAPGTNTGAASPVSLVQMDETMRKKVENDTAAWLRSIVSRRGRNLDAAQKTVSEARSFTDREALDAGLIELVAGDEQALLAAVDGRTITRFDGSKAVLHTKGARIVPYTLSLREQVLQKITDPNLAFLMLVFGALGLYLEFTNPGLVLPGVLGGLLLILGLFALSLLPWTWLGATLLVLAVALFVLEAFFTSKGLLGAAGAVCLALGALLLVEGPPDMRVRPLVAVGAAAPFAAITVFLGSLAVKAHRRKVLTGSAAMIGEVGEARTALAPAGTVFVHGEYWEAVSSTAIASGSPVRVVAIEGWRLRVEPEAR
ncbi:MAG: nodulation protein NfeD [Bryobacteraceae bacterium]|nr:nodulation protein NfeD [Bryobacteraceae bacterium]